MEDLEAVFEKFRQKIGNKEYMRALWYMAKQNVPIEELFNNDLYNNVDVNEYFKTHNEPDNEDWLNYITQVGEKVSGLKEFLTEQIKTKKGDQEFDAYKHKSHSK